MSLIYLVFVAALDLAGVFFNIQMLQKYFKGKMNNTFLHKCRALIICQCACQVTILVTNAVESWKLWLDIHPRETCNVFRVLSLSTIFFQACNLTAILINYSDHRMACENTDLSSRLKMSAALSLGFIGSAITVWYCCFPQEFLSQMVVKGVLFMVTVMFFILLFATASKNIHEQVEDTNPHPAASTKTHPLLWNACKENKRSTLMLFITLLLIYLALILRMLPCSSFSLDFEQARFFQDVIYSLITSYVFGIVLPLAIIDVIDSSYEEEGNERKVVLI